MKIVSVRLWFFNTLLKLISRTGLGLRGMHNSNDVTAFFREHAAQYDNLIGFFGCNYTEPLFETANEKYKWVGDKNEKKRHILYIHGGGFTMNMPKVYRYWTDRLATLNDAAVLWIDYPLAPESPYPGGLDFCVEAYRWMIEEEIVDPKTIVIGGDSAGANLALTTLLRIRDEGLPLPSCVFSLAPVTDLSLETPSMTENARTDYIANLPSLEKVRTLYVPNEDLNNPFISPLYGDVKGLPPIHLQVSDEELSRDESLYFYNKFKNDSEMELVMCRKTPHCHQVFGFLPEAIRDREKIRAFIAKHC